MKTTFSALKWCDMEVVMARKGGSRDRYTGLQDVSLMEADKFSREFDGLIGSRKKRY
jgi:hypothetical protein